MLAIVALPVVAPAQFGGLDPIGVAMALTAVILSLTFHEAAHAWVALRCGDTTGKDLGRLTLNPLPHIDPVMTVIVPLISYVSMGWFFGGAKPVPVAFHRLRHPWRDMMLVAFAGPFSNLLLALFFYVVWGVLVAQRIYDPAQRLPEVLYAVYQFNVLLAVFNLVPIPPLDGSRVMAWLLPSRLRESYLSIERFGLLLILGLFYFGPRLASYGVPNLSLWVQRGVHWVMQRIESIAAVFGVS